MKKWPKSGQILQNGQLRFFMASAFQKWPNFSKSANPGSNGVLRSGDARGECLIGCPPLQILVLSSGVLWSLLLDIRCL